MAAAAAVLLSAMIASAAHVFQSFPGHHCAQVMVVLVTYVDTHIVATQLVTSDCRRHYLFVISSNANNIMFMVLAPVTFPVLTLFCIVGQLRHLQL
jgi:hypothetical protein